MKKKLILTKDTIKSLKVKTNVQGGLSLEVQTQGCPIVTCFCTATSCGGASAGGSIFQ